MGTTAHEQSLGVMLLAWQALLMLLHKDLINTTELKRLPPLAYALLIVLQELFGGQHIVQALASLDDHCRHGTKMLYFCHKLYPNFTWAPLAVVVAKQRAAVARTC